MATRIKLRRDTAANWASANPILALGEPGLETDTRKVKYGDGSTAWNSLQYAAGGTGGTGTDYTLPVATGSVLGGIKIGAGLSIDGSGVVSVTGGGGGGTSTYTLTTATASALGGVKLGSGLTATGDGTVSVASQTANFAFTTNTIVNSSVDQVTLQTAGNLRINNLAGVTEFGASTGKIVINGQSGILLMPNGGQISGSSGGIYTLTNVSRIVFADSTEISTAVLQATTSTLTAGTWTVALSSTGTTSLAGDLRFPAITQPSSYQVECSAVGSGQATLEPGVYPLPQIGWYYNNLEITGVTNISGRFLVNFNVQPQFTTGTYALTTGAPGVNKKIIFSDGTVQETAFDPNNLFVTATIDLSQVNQDIVPAADATYDLGSSSTQWRSLYVSSSTIYIGGKSLAIDAAGTLLVEGAEVTGGVAAETTQTWTPADASTWRIVEWNGNFGGTYQQDTALQTYNVRPAGAGSSSTIYIDRGSYSQIDAIAPKIDYITIGAITYNITGTTDLIYPEGVILYVQTPINDPYNLTTATDIVITYTEPGGGPLKWFDFTAAPYGGTDLMGGVIEYHAAVNKNDGAGDFGGAVGTIVFNVASQTFDQTYLPFGPATATNYVNYDSTATGGFAYTTDVGLGQNDRLKIQWKSRLFYNGTWGNN